MKSPGVLQRLKSFLNSCMYGDILLNEGQVDRIFFLKQRGKYLFLKIEFLLKN